MKYIYLTLAFLCLICGSVGIVIPGLPTTPLLLAASFFFAKGSDRFHRWFLGTKLYHKHLESFVQHKEAAHQSVHFDVLHLLHGTFHLLGQEPLCSHFYCSHTCRSIFLLHFYD